MFAIQASVVEKNEPVIYCRGKKSTSHLETGKSKFLSLEALCLSITLCSTWDL